MNVEDTNETTLDNYISFRADGVRAGTDMVSWNSSLGGLLERSAGAVSYLLQVHGPYAVRPEPQFEDDFIVFEVVSPDGRSFDGAAFEKFAQQISDHMSGRRSDPSACQDSIPATQEIARVSESLRRFGKLCLRVGGSGRLILLNGVRESRTDESNILNLDVSVVNEVGEVDLSEGKFLAPADYAAQLHKGDRIDAKDIQIAKKSRRVFASIISITDSDDGLPDLFDPTEQGSDTEGSNEAD